MSLKRISLLAAATAVGFVMVACTTVVPGPASSLPSVVAAPSPVQSQSQPQPQASSRAQVPQQPTRPQPQVQQQPQAPSVQAPVLTPLPPLAVPTETLRPATFSALPGWASDDLRAALPAFLISCEVMARRPDWARACAAARVLPAQDSAAIRRFFESYFTPHQVINQDGTTSGLVTGYYEPLLRGSRTRGGPYQTPLHRVPEDMLQLELASVYPEVKGVRLRGRLVGNKVMPYWTRAEMMKAGILDGKELLWVDDPIEAFFLQVQGSGRVQLAEGNEVVRVAYADQNGHPYRSIGRYLVEKGEMTLDQASAQSIKAWYIANPARQQELLNVNPSYVFFREEKIDDPSRGPKGAMGLPLTPQRSIAVDPQFVPLGVPVFLSTTHPNSNVPLQRLVVAQDTGSAIRNPVRADFFWGFGAAAGEMAGRMKQRGTMWVLLPNAMRGAKR